VAQVLTSETFDKLLEGALQQHVANETEKAIEAAKAKLDATLREALGTVVMALFKHYRVDIDEKQIVITVKNEAKL